jgi:phosphoribosyl 1,2-cyclic phosphodiesterase
MELSFWGVRGSLPSPGPDTVRYGGNTACVALRAADDHLLVFDAGSGIRLLGAQVDAAIRRIDVFVTHLHMDHIQGLGFFAPLFDPGIEVHLWGPRSATASFVTRMMRYLSAPLFPVHLWELPCKLEVRDVPFEEFRVGDVDVVADLVCHPGTTVGYRVSCGGRTVAYIPDHEPALCCHAMPGPVEWRSGEELSGGADILVHDAQYDDLDYAARVGWGHSTWEHTVAYAAAVGAKRLVPFHFDPTYSDDRIDALFLRSRPPRGLVVEPAREGLRIPL